MGTSGTPEIMTKIIESFAGKPYRVIAPVRYQLDKVPGVRIPANVVVTGWLPAQDVNKLADLSLIHGGIGTVMTAAYAGKPVVGVGMQPEQVANLACLVRKGFAIRVPKSRDPSRGSRRRSRGCCTMKKQSARLQPLRRSWSNGTGPGWQQTCYTGNLEDRLTVTPELWKWADNVYVIEGPAVRDMGIMFTTRMVIVKLADGTLWLDSPVPLPFETLLRITELGPVRYLVAATPAARLAAGCLAHALSRGPALGASANPIYHPEGPPPVDRHPGRRAGK